MSGPIEAFAEQLSTEELSDVVVIVASQDPTEAKPGGGARWNKEQRELILAAQEVASAEGLID